MNRPLRSRLRIALNGLVLLVGCLTGTAVAAVTAQHALARTVPPPSHGLDDGVRG
jgi:hypothetical protein